MILPPARTTSPSEDIAAAREAEQLGFDTVWIGDRHAPTSPSRLAALAATVPRVTLGMGLVPLSSRSADQLEETLTTLSLVAPRRVALAFAVPHLTGVPAAASRHDRLEVVSPVVRRAHIPLSVEVVDAASALRVAPHVDRVVLQGADVTATAEVAAALTRLDRVPEIEVWLDLAPEARRETMRAVLAERIAVPGVAGHGVAVRLAKRSFPGLQGDVESAYARGRLDEAAALIPDELLAATTLLGTDRATEYAAAGATRLTVRPRGVQAADRLTTLRAFGVCDGPAARDEI